MALPAAAFDIGVTNAGDGKSIQFRIDNFPQIDSPADLNVSFGHVYCDGTSCGITNIETSTTFSKIRVTVPSLPVGTTTLKVDFIGLQRPPLGRDNMNGVVRTVRSAELRDFQVLPATPEVSGVKFCRTCTQRRSCLSTNGLCGDGTLPLSWKIPNETKQLSNQD